MANARNVVAELLPVQRLTETNNKRERAMQDVWDSAIDGVVTDIFGDTGCDRPPVDVVEIAERLAVPVFEQERMDVRGKLVRQQTGDVIVVRREQWEERTQYTVAHELGERYAEAVCLRAGEDILGLSAAFIEALAHRFAARLLCPESSFRRDTQRLDGDLFDLKDIYETASHEVIAFRLLHLETASVVTVLDNGRLVRRGANRPGLQSRKLTPLEDHAWECCRLTGRVAHAHDGTVRVDAWPIWEADFRREILRAWNEDCS